MSVRVKRFALALTCAALAALSWMSQPHFEAETASLADLTVASVREDARLDAVCDGTPFWLGRAGATSEIEQPPRLCFEAAARPVWTE